MIEKFKEFVLSSGLSDEDKALWSKLWEAAPVEVMQQIIEAVNFDLAELTEATGNIKIKIKALESGDEKLAQAIIEEEEND